MTLNTQLLRGYGSPSSYFEDFCHPHSYGRAYEPMDPFHFFENNLMKDILASGNSSDNESYVASTVKPLRGGYAKAAGSQDDMAARRTTPTRPNSDDVSQESDDQASSFPVPTPVLDFRAPLRPPGSLRVGTNRQLNYAKPHQRHNVHSHVHSHENAGTSSSRRKLHLKPFMDRVFESPCDEREESFMNTRMRNLMNLGNLTEFILDE